MNKNFLVTLLLALCSPAGFCGSLPSPSVSNSVGVNLTFTSTAASTLLIQNDIPMMAAAGVKIARLDFSWDLTEKAKNSYDWTAYDTIVNSLIQHGIRPYLILNHSNQLYEPGCVNEASSACSPDAPNSFYSPQSTESVAAFASWAAAAVLHFSDPHFFPVNPQIIWELWNEPNYPKFWNRRAGSPSVVSQYLTLARTACNAIRAAAPDATIVGPALSKIDLSPSNPKSGTDQAMVTKEFVRTLLDPASGLRTCLDAFSVHPYRAGDAIGDPETVAADYVTLRELMDDPLGVAGLGTLPIISGEWGYYSIPIGSGVTPVTQAAYVVRQQLINLVSNVPISIWYNWKDNGINPADGEQNYGLVAGTTIPNTASPAKLSYTALKTMTTELTGYELQSRIPMANPLDFALLFKNAAGRYRLAMWTRDIYHLTSPSPVGTPLTPTSSVDMLGNRTSLAPILGIPPSILLTAFPQYIE